ncbi:hypothetical protein DNTS_033429 [Danionella cerebrum]|uniref:Rho-GAP domain-containing protein n=1 Tax=Danionella cerebrum TaxID=2873325 RepID=A0A553R919_9TELE|nr:hypothetical protein DNTS_033429 [Danionella translucida]
MAGLIEERVRVVAIINALKAVGIRVKNWKNFLNGNSNCDQTLPQESPPRFAFGRELVLLPQHQLPDTGGSVPQFLFEACEYLSQHFQTEGLFRKTGSLNRIRALRADLELGKPIFHPPHADLLQPCDVASLIKQFLRELPSPLIPTELQIPLIQAQGLEMAHDQGGARNRTTLLLTALFPASNACALRYICTFLSQVADRCGENRMDVSSLAVVIAPNLLQSPTQPYKLTLDTEKHLDQQTSVIKSLILHADRIGVVPTCLLEATKAPGGTETLSPAGGTIFSKRTGLGVYRSLRRQRRRSVGEIFVDAFSKLKPCRTPTGPPIFLDGTSATPLSKSPTPQSPVTVKRKATEESLPELEGSARKRPPVQEEKVHQRKRSLRFFTLSSGNSSNQLSVPHKDPENCTEAHKEQPNFVVGNDVEDDPDLLNCSFVESPSDCLQLEPEVTFFQRQDSEVPCDDECWTVLENENVESLSDCNALQSVQNVGPQIRATIEVESRPDVKKLEEPPNKEPKRVKNSTKNRSRPRRSISLPEVTFESCVDALPDLVKDFDKGKPEMANTDWSVFGSLTLSNEQPNVTLRKKRGIKEDKKQGKIADSTLGFKRPHQRLSMAERLRGFSALGLLLRTSRAAPQFLDKPQESLQRGSTRLKRQGARRFGRSISHEVVTERPPEEEDEDVGSPPPNQAYVGLYDLSPDSGVESVDQEPIIDLINQKVSKGAHHPFKAHLRNEVDLNAPSSTENQDQTFSTFNATECKFTCKKMELDLHKLLDQKCHISGPNKKDVPTPDLSSPVFFQQMVPLNLFEDPSSVEDLGTDQASPQPECDHETTSWLNPSPPFEFPPFGSLMYGSVGSEDDGRSRGDLSPPTLQFKRSITRRRYRDSPRWPSHEVRMSTWNPLPL